MPTREVTRRFLREYSQLTDEQKAAFRAALKHFVAGLATGHFDPALRIKRVQGYPGVWEMTWAPNGRATFQYGSAVRPREPHVVWRRIGTHAIFVEP